MQTDPESAADVNNRSAHGHRLRNASMDQDENVEDSAEVKITLQSLNSKIPLTL